MRKACLTAALAFGLVGTPPAATAQLQWSGAILFGTDASGQYIGGPAWNTLGGDGTWNLYIRESGAFLNTGNGPAAALNHPLGVGTHVFELRAESCCPSGVYGLNLFFGGDPTSPGASVLALADAAPTAFVPNGSASTLALGSTAVPRVPGAGTASYTSGGLTATITAFTYSNTGVSDLVQPFDAVPSGSADFGGRLTIEVTSVSAVPEPATLALVALGAPLAFALARRRRP